jgi:hypothetical protein
VSSFEVTVGEKTRRVKTFRDAQSAIARAITDLMARDPEAVARDAGSVNEAMVSGAAEHSVTAHRQKTLAVAVADAEAARRLLEPRRRQESLGLFLQRMVFTPAASGSGGESVPTRGTTRVISSLQST